MTEFTVKLISVCFQTLQEFLKSQHVAGKQGCILFPF